MSDASPPRLYFDAVLTPHRALDRRGFLLVIAALGGLSFLSGVIFALHGAWPVVGFFGLDVALVYWAFKLNYAGALRGEALRLSDTALEIANISPACAASVWRFEPTWVRIDVDEGLHNQARLTVWSKGQGLEIGAFLSPDERRSLADALRTALAERRSALVQPG